MALLPARRNSTLSRPRSQPPARWDPFAGSGDLHQLMSGAPGGGWQPPAQGWAPLAGLSETDQACLAEAGLPGVARDDTSAPGWPARNWPSAASTARAASTAGHCAAGGARAGPGTGCCWTARPTWARSPRPWRAEC
jgi:hypothetical protein